MRRQVDAIRNAGAPPAAWEQALGLTPYELRGAVRLIGLTEENASGILVIRDVLKDGAFFWEVVVSGRKPSLRPAGPTRTALLH